MARKKTPIPKGGNSTPPVTPSLKRKRYKNSIVNTTKGYTWKDSKGRISYRDERGRFISKAEYERRQRNYQPTIDESNAGFTPHEDSERTADDITQIKMRISQLVTECENIFRSQYAKDWASVERRVQKIREGINYALSSSIHSYGEQNTFKGIAENWDSFESDIQYMYGSDCTRSDDILASAVENLVELIQDNALSRQEQEEYNSMFDAELDEE